MPTYHSKVVTSGDGVTTTFNVPFPYLDESHVKAYVDGVEDTDFTFPTSSQITFSTPPASGSLNLLIQRETPKTTRVVDWESGAQIEEVNLDNADLQMLYIVQEAFDAAADTVNIPAGEINYVASSKRITDIADGVDEQDAATVGQINALTGSAVAAAETAQVNAETAESGAEVAQGLAEDEADSAALSAAAALSSEELAEKWAEEAEDVEVEAGRYSAKHWAAKAEASSSTTADLVSYDNSAADLSATDVKGGLDELAERTGAATETKAGLVTLNQIPVAKGSILHGLTISNNATDSDHDLDIENGAAVTLDGTVITLDTAITKRLDATFAEGDGNGGFADGESLPTNGTVHVWLISKADGTTDVFANAQNPAEATITLPTLPTGFVNKKRIGSRVTSASADIIPVFQDGNRFRLVEPIEDFSGTVDTTGIDVSLSVPSGKTLSAILFARAGIATAASAIYMSNPDIVPSNWGDHMVAYADIRSSIYGQFLTNNTGQVTVRTNESQAVELATWGWIDNLKGV